MTVYQHYYTAWYDSSRGSSGQHTKAQSPEVPFDLESNPTWVAMKDYAFPPGVSDDDVKRHPVALRYLPLTSDSALLMQYTSTGKGADVERTDSEIRYGNMFIHTLVLSPRDFVKAAPIQYWGSPFWQSDDATPTRHDLDAMTSFDVAPSLTLPQVVNFIEHQPSGWERLTALLSAVIGNARAPRPVLIVNDSDAVAHWIAGVSLLLPPSYRPLLSFSTYSHAYPSRYMITGLHPDQFNKLHVARDFRDYFVLGGGSDSSDSEIAPDPYAQFATQCLREHTYESALGSLFQIARRYFGEPTSVADNLGALHATRTLFDLNRTIPYTPDEVDALSAFVNAEVNKFESEDTGLESLRNLHTTCLRAVAQNLAPIPFEPYRQIVSALVRRDVSHWAQELVVDLCSALELLGQNAIQRPQEIVTTVKRLCPTSEQTTALTQQPQWVQALIAHSPVGLSIHLRIWDVLGRYIIPETVPPVWLQATLKAAFGNVSGAQNQEQEALETILYQRCSPNALEWAKRIRELRGQLDPKTTQYVEQFYYNCLVRNLWPPSERTPVRQIIREVAPNVSDTEAYEDLRKRAGENGEFASDVLDEWSSLASQAPVRWTVVLEKFAFLASFVPRTVAVALLARIDETTRIKSGKAALYLADAVIPGIQICPMSRDEERVCANWYGDTHLSHEAREYASAIIEALQGRATTKHVELLRKKLFHGDVKSQQYLQRCEQYLWQRLASGGALNSHASDIQILYDHKRSDMFWKAYWPFFDQALFDPSKEQVLFGFFEFWFEHAESVLGAKGYTKSEFLQQLTSYIRVCATKRKQELTAVYARLEKQKRSTQWLATVLPMMEDALNKRGWPLGRLWLI